MSAQKGRNGLHHGNVLRLAPKLRTKEAGWESMLSEASQAQKVQHGLVPMQEMERRPVVTRGWGSRKRGDIGKIYWWILSHYFREERETVLQCSSIR